MNILDFLDYRSYLTAYLQAQPNKGHGKRSEWAQAMNCQVAYVSHVMTKKNDFSLEQAEALSRHLGHNKEETEFFLLLIEKERAGSHHLKKIFSNMIDEKIKSRENIRTRMKIKDNLSIEDQAIYYSTWHYSAIHMALTIPSLQTNHELTKYFNLSLSTVNECLGFLVDRKLIQIVKNRYEVIGAFLHLSKDSPLFFSQQNFYRHKAIESIFRNNEEDLHFSSMFTLSNSDVSKIKTILLNAIEKSTQVIRPSKEEKIYAICLDYFELK